MKLKDIVEKADLQVFHAGESWEHEAGPGYVGDLLSDVIASGRKNMLWITIQVHENIVAVASLKDLAGIILAKGNQPHDDTLTAARSENITLLGSRLNAYQLIEKLVGLGVSGNA